MVLDTIDKGMRTYIYRLRTQILSKIFPVKQAAYTKSSIIDCATSVNHLANILFEKSPSFKEVSSCNKGCPSRHKKLMVIQIESDVLSNAELFKDIIKLHAMLSEKMQCCKKNCNGIEESKKSLPDIYSLHFCLQFLLKHFYWFIILFVK